MENSMQDVLSRYICQELLRQKDKTLNGQDALLSSGLIDSFHVVDLALFVEDTFGVILDDTELNTGTFDTLSDLVQLIEQRKPQA
jgi:acyl carrier protein